MKKNYTRILVPDAKGRKEMFNLTTHSTHFLIYGLYGVRHMVRDHTYSERGNPLPPHGLLFPISNKGSFICTILQKNPVFNFNSVQAFLIFCV